MCLQRRRGGGGLGVQCRKSWVWHQPDPLRSYSHALPFSLCVRREYQASHRGSDHPFDGIPFCSSFGRSRVLISGILNGVFVVFFIPSCPWPHAFQFTILSQPIIPRYKLMRLKQGSCGFIYSFQTRCDAVRHPVTSYPGEQSALLSFFIRRYITPATNKTSKVTEVISSKAIVFYSWGLPNCVSLRPLQFMTSVSGFLFYYLWKKSR